MPSRAARRSTTSSRSVVGRSAGRTLTAKVGHVRDQRRARRGRRSGRAATGSPRATVRLLRRSVGEAAAVDDLEVEQPRRQRRRRRGRRRARRRGTATSAPDRLRPAVEVACSPVHPLLVGSAVMDRDHQRPDERGEDGVVDGARQDTPRAGSATGMGARRALKRDEQGHRVHAGSGGRRRRWARAVGGERTSRPRSDGAADAEEQREGGRPERSLVRGHRGRGLRRRPRRGRPRARPRRSRSTPTTRTRCGCGVADPEVRADGEFQEGRHRRADRGEEQGHRASRSSASWPGSRAADRRLGDDRTAATSGGSIPRASGPGNGRRPAAATSPGDGFT